MKITLTANEIEHAIASYLRANAAVIVGEMTFSLKKTGLEAEVETEVKEPEDANPIYEFTTDELAPEKEPEIREEFDTPETPPEHQADASELVDHIPEKVEPTEVGTQLDIEDAIAAIEATERPVLSFEPTVTSDVVEEMRVSNSVSIAEMLGVNGG